MIEMRPASCMPDSCFCEAIRNDGIRQPANSLSSLAFVVIAAIVLFHGWRSDRVTASLFALTLALTGIGSALYHASLSFTGQFFDMLGMYLIATLALLLSLGRIRQLSTVAMMAAYAATNSLLAAILWIAPVYRRWIFAALLAGIIAVELRDRTADRRYMMRAIAVMGIAFRDLDPGFHPHDLLTFELPSRARGVAHPRGTCSVVPLFALQWQSCRAHS